MKLVAALVAISLLNGCSSAAQSGDPETSADGGTSTNQGGDNGNPGATVTPPTGGDTTGGSDASVDAKGPGAPGTTGTPPDIDGGLTPDGGGSPPIAGGVFTGAPAYAATLGPSTLIKRHVFSGDNPAGQPCLTCHTGVKGVPLFLFAGTVYADTAGTKPAASIEVRVRDAAGQAHSAYTDANGNFFFEQGALPPIAAPATAGIRDATNARSMTNAINDGNCNGCHRVGGEGTLHLP